MTRSFRIQLEEQEFSCQTILYVGEKYSCLGGIGVTRKVHGTFEACESEEERCKAYHAKQTTFESARYQHIDEELNAFLITREQNLQRKINCEETVLLHKGDMIGFGYDTPILYYRFDGKLTVR